MTADKPRCPWGGINDPEYARYHDEEWGVPVFDSRALFERMTLEAFQSGLSWLTILKKRDNFRRAFANFEPSVIARYGKRDVTRLMRDAGIVRNAAKIDATIANARAYLDLAKEQPFAQFLWAFAPSTQHVPATAAAKTLAKALKQRGFRFVGPTTAYSLMQATGMVNDHTPGCHRHAACARLQAKAQRTFT